MCGEIVFKHLNTRWRGYNEFLTAILGQFDQLQQSITRQFNQLVVDRHLCIGEMKVELLDGQRAIRNMMFHRNQQNVMGNGGSAKNSMGPAPLVQLSECADESFEIGMCGRRFRHDAYISAMQ